MKRLIALALAPIALVYGVVVGSVAVAADANVAQSSAARVAEAVPPGPVIDSTETGPAVASVSSGTPWTGLKFASPWICAQNDIGTLWNIEGASTAFESGIVNGDPRTVNIEHYGPGEGSDFDCIDHYSSTQTIRFTTYSAADGKCWQMSYTQFGGQYTGQVTIWMNIHESVYLCRNSLQHRNNLISRAIGTALGLLQFYSDTAWQASIMNTKFVNLYNFPGSDDRNSLYNLY